MRCQLLSTDFAKLAAFRAAVAAHRSSLLIVLAAKDIVALAEVIEELTFSAHLAGRVYTSLL